MAKMHQRKIARLDKELKEAQETMGATWTPLKESLKPPLINLKMSKHPVIAEKRRS